MKPFIVFVFLQSFLTYRETLGLDISDFITPCSAKDPNINECVKKAGEMLIPKIAAGVSEWKIPSADPMKTSELIMKDNNGDNDLIITYKNIVQTGFSSVIIENADVDLAHGVMTFKLKYPQITFAADYIAKGQFFGFLANGDGKANVTVWNPYSSFVLKFRVVNDYIKINSLIIGFSFDKIYLDYSNLMWNGDKELSDSAGTFINENSAEIIESFKPELEKFYTKIIWEFVQAFFDAVPYRVLFKNT